MYVGVDTRNAWGHSSRSGWCEDSLHVQPMFTIKDDDFCDDTRPEAYPFCDCYASPNYRWSLGPMTLEEEREFIRCEHTNRWPLEKDGEDHWIHSPDYTQYMLWWRNAGQRNNLMKEVPRGPVSR